MENDVIVSKTIPDRWFPSNDRVAYDEKVGMDDDARANDNSEEIHSEHYDIFGFNNIRLTDDFDHNDKASPKSLKPDQTNSPSNFSNTAMVVGYKVY